MYFDFILGIQSEPPMQSKKRTEGPQTTLTNGFYDYGPDQDEYALLGNQDKFAHNVKYKLRESLRAREVSPPKQMKLQKVCYDLVNTYDKKAYPNVLKYWDT